MSSVCALCQREKPLVRSHVIPEFLYREMYDDKHRFHVISTNAPGKHKLLQKGVRERLLCRDCENVLSISERYVNLVFTGKLPVKTHRSGQLYEIQGLDYRKFRLFGLSVLWRASVASHRFFRAVNLGPHESAIRQMILAQESV